ncbi:MAG: 30S ribosomal protein S16 [Cyclobacteriaceae bacterium]
MAVKIRLSRRGRKKQAMYDVVVADARAPRDGRFIEKLGTYNPNTNPASININDEKALSWVMTGAQPTDTVRAILSYRGIMFRKHLQIGVNKGAITQEEADTKFEKWIEGKSSQIQGKMDSLAKDKASQTKAKLEAEAKVNQARLESILARKKEADAALAADVAAANADEAETEMSEEAEEIVSEAKAEDSTDAAEESEKKES